MSPYILSVSRREDVPAFRSDWFMNTINNGFVDMSSIYKNYRINYDKVKMVVFWTKNPEPMIKHIDNIPFMSYFQFTLNYYPEYEHNVPDLMERIETFKLLSDKIGKNRVIWRFDPIIVNDNISINDVLDRIEIIGNNLHKYTDKLIFSFVDPYKKLGHSFSEIDYNDKLKIGQGLVNLNKNWGLSIETCSENFSIDGIVKSHCIDNELIKKLLGDNHKWLTNTKDKNQRPLCGCISSTDIGSYRKCRHNCDYCYSK